MTEQIQKIKKHYASVKMTEPFRDYWLRKPTRKEVLQALASLIMIGELDDIFTVTWEET